MKKTTIIKRFGRVAGVVALAGALACCLLAGCSSNSSSNDTDVPATGEFKSTVMFCGST